MKKEKIKEEEPVKITEAISKDQTKQLRWVLGIMVSILVVGLLTFLVIDSINKFSYNGLAFTKERFGEIPVYHHYYYFKDLEGQTYKYNLYLRNDPRENSVPIMGKITYTIGNPIFFSINTTKIDQCNESVLAVSSLSSFLTNNLLQVKAATPDPNNNSTRIPYAVCGDPKDSKVILLEFGNETKITSNGNCHTIRISKCEDVLLAIEKFEVQSILDSRNK